MQVLGSARRQRLGCQVPVRGRTCRTRRLRSNPTAMGRRNLVVRAGPVEIDEEDLMQHPDRLRWYESTFAANDMPDWNKALLLDSQDAAPGLRCITLSVQVARERVPLRNAYKAAGQRARVRVGDGVEALLPVASPPHTESLNRQSLVRTRGDINAYATKTVIEPTDVMAPLELLVSRAMAPELYDADPSDPPDLNLGPFEGAGLDLRGSGLMGIWRFPTLVLFVEGAGGIAAARALVESPPELAGLQLALRSDVVMYYRAPNDASFVYRERFPAWRAAGCRVVTTTRSFQDAFDDDDELAYDPDSTGAIILTGGDEEAEAAAREVCAEAEISTVLSDGPTGQATPPEYLSGTPSSFAKWGKARDQPMEAAAAAT